jgi:PAS domain S-box-containing protein
VRTRRTPLWIIACAALTVALLVLDLLASSGGEWQDGVRTITLAGLAVLLVWGVRVNRRQADADAGRRALQGRLEESFGLLDVIFEQAPIGLAFFDRDLRFARVNDRLAEINGLSVAEHLGRRITEVLPEVPDEVEDDLRRVLATGEPLSEVQVAGVTPAHPGVRREWLSSYWPVRQGVHGAITGVGCVVFDVTGRRQAQRELRAETDRHEALLLALSEAGTGMLVLEADGRCVYANAAFEHLSGHPFPELAAMESTLGVLDPDRREQSLHRRDGHVLDIEVVAVPLHVEGRHRLVVVAHDVTDRRRMEVERACLLRRSAVMAAASELFDEVLDEAATLERVARLCVRELAETCVVALGESPDAIRRVAAAARDPSVERTLLELQLRYPLDEEPIDALTETLRSGRALVIDPIGDEFIEARALDERHGDLIRRLGTHVGVIVPLRARGVVRGVIALGFCSLPEHERPELVRLCGDVGRRAAFALETARLHDERAAVARTLQRALMPPALPDVPGVELAARYLAAGEATEVGGDFYDCFATGDGEWAAVIGDVCGRGAAAAAITALARHTIRAAVVHDPRPAAVLHELNAALLRHDSEGDFRFCTVLYVRLRPSLDGMEACVATAGHPLPLVLRASGHVDVAGSAGTLLGVIAEPQIAEETVRLRSGDALVLFTDGVIEATPAHGAFGPEQLAGFLGACAGKDAGRIAASIERRVLEHQHGRLRDDVALVVLRVAPGAAPSFDPLLEGVAARS